MTICGLTGAVSIASLMLALSRKFLQARYVSMVSAVAMLNAIVLFCCRNCIFIGSALVDGKGAIVWHQEYYLHVVGPPPMLVDALFIDSAFI